MERSLGIFENLDMIGGMFYIYAVARLINFWRLHYEDCNEKSTIEAVLGILYLILCVLSFPVSIIMFGINYFYNGHIEQLHTKELIDESNKQRAYMKEHEIWPLQRKVTELNCQLAWQEKKSIKMREEGYTNGFNAGFEKCLEYTYYSEDEKEALKERARRETLSD